MTASMPGGTVAADPDIVPDTGPQVGFEAGELLLPARPKALGYVRLSKARVYHYVYGWALGALLLWTDGGADAGSVPALVFVLAGTLAAQWSASAADDVSGFLDGSDARNYAGRPAVTVVRKPLVTGALTVAEARRFAVVTWSAGMAAVVLAAAVMPGPVAWPALVVGLVTPALGIQYSWGAKLSYRPLGLEATIVLAVPVLLLHLVQLYFGTYRGQLRTARFLVLLSIDVGVFGLAAALLLDRA